MVALGILASRVVGLVRLRFLGHYLGVGDAADAFAAAFRIPNLLQNLFGEGALSASFIPVYARLLGAGSQDEARRVARAVGALLALVVGALVLVGVVATPFLIDLIAPGFEGAKRDLTIRLVRIFFPGAGLFVLSAWCLGILNSHGKFFLSYAAPVVWNLSIIAALVWWGGRVGELDLVVAAAWGSVVGAALQVLVQLPTVWTMLKGIPGAMSGTGTQVRTVVRNFLPAFLSRGVVQISAYVDTLIATLLPSGAVAALSYAQNLYVLPVSLFGMSVSAAELPRMSGESGASTDQDQRDTHLRARLEAGLRQISFFVIPTCGIFLALGQVVAAALFETGRFNRADSFYVWRILAGAGIGLLPGTLGRLYSSTFYAIQDTRTPMRFAIIRVLTGVALGFLLAVYVPRAYGIEADWGAPGLALAGSLAGWLEFLLLRRSLSRVVGRTVSDSALLARLWGAAAVAALGAWGVLKLVHHQPPILVFVLVIGAYSAIYLGITHVMGVHEARAFVARLRRSKGA
jgi:putative peptidoglycan lipid II flippase